MTETLQDAAFERSRRAHAALRVLRRQIAFSNYPELTKAANEFQDATGVSTVADALQRVLTIRAQTLRRWKTGDFNAAQFNAARRDLNTAIRDAKV